MGEWNGSNMSNRNWKREEIHTSPSSSEEEEGKEAYRHHSTFPPSWSNDRHFPPSSPIRTTNSFDGYTSPFPFYETAGASYHAAAIKSNNFEGHHEYPERHPFEQAIDQSYSLSASSPFVFHNADMHTLEESTLEPQPYVSRMVYCFDPYLISSNWHTMYNKDISSADRKPSPIHPRPCFDSTDQNASPASEPYKDDPHLPETASSDLKVPPVASLEQPQLHVPKKSPRKKLANRRGGKRLARLMNLQGHDEHASPNREEKKMPMTNRAKRALDSWYERYNELVDYKNAYGDTNVPQQFKKNHALGIWVNKQRMEMKARQEKHKCSMTERRIELLEKISFEWAKPKGQAAWEQRYEELIRYKEQHGNCHVPTKHRDNRPLGRWVSTQRNMYKNFHSTPSAKPTSLSKGEIRRRIQKLDAIGFAWCMIHNSSSSSDGSTEEHSS